MAYLESTRRNLSKEWKYWENYYKNKGCSYNKILKLSHNKMRKLYGCC